MSEDIGVGQMNFVLESTRNIYNNNEKIMLEGLMLKTVNDYCQIAQEAPNLKKFSLALT